MTGLRVTLTAPHGGLPAGSEIVVGYAEASRRCAAERPPPQRRPTTRRPGPAATAAEAARARRTRCAAAAHAAEPTGGADGAARPAVFKPAAWDRRRAHRPAATSSRSTARSASATPSAPRARAPAGTTARTSSAARPADPRRHGRDDLLGRLERHRRLPALAPRPPGQPVLLRAPLGVLVARGQRPRGEGRPRDRVHGQHGRRRSRRRTTSTSRSTRSRCCSSGYDGVIEPYAVPDRVAAPRGRLLRHGQAGCRRRRSVHERARARGDPAQVVGHLAAPAASTQPRSSRRRSSPRLVGRATAALVARARDALARTDEVTSTRRSRPCRRCSSSLAEPER